MDRVLALVSIFIPAFMTTFYLSAFPQFAFVSLWFVIIHVCALLFPKFILFIGLILNMIFLFGDGIYTEFDSEIDILLLFYFMPISVTIAVIIRLYFIFRRPP